MFLSKSSYLVLSLSQINTTLTFNDVLPSTKTIASFKLPDYNSGKVRNFASSVQQINDWLYIVLKICLICLWQLEVQYFHDHATLMSAVTLNQSPLIDVSVTVGTPTIAFGIEAGYDTTTGGFTKYTSGINFTRLDSTGSIIM